MKHSGISSAVADGLDVLLVDDDDLQLRTLARQLELEGFRTHRANSADAALTVVQSRPIGVVVSDIGLGERSGVDLLRDLRVRAPEIPVVLMTGSPDLATATAAVELGAVRYLRKPVEHGELMAAIFSAARRRSEPRLAIPDPSHACELERAFQSLWLAYQPIVTRDDGRVSAREALLRCRIPTYANPLAFLDATRAMGESRRLGRRIRSEVAAAIARTPSSETFFVNLQASDLEDESLFDESEPLTAHAHRVVLELTERQSFERIDDLTDRLQRLRRLGYRIAIDDLGAGYSSLSALAVVAPDVVKLDMSLIRNLDTDATKQRVVGALVTLSHDLAISVVAEGIETASEYRVARNLGCDLFQGYLFGRPTELAAAPQPGG